jgi:uncharacterized protein YndB with AHSA1/START domain
MSEATEVKIVREFNAPVEQVWEAWSSPELMKQWWGPKDFTAPTIKIDFRAGGKYLYAMHGPAGTEYDIDMWNTGTYKEIVPNKRIVYLDSFSDADGNPVPSSVYGMSGFPDQMLVTIEFEALEGGKTRLTLTHVGAPAGIQADNMTIGWNQSLDKLAASL